MAIRLTVNTKEVTVSAGTPVAVAVLMAGGFSRGPLCGMGICFDCSATVDGVDHCRTCQMVCREGMEVRTP
jgi:sarcosine oxidase subunit alpha